METVVYGKRGYAFIDMDGHCIVITYGESNLKKMKVFIDGTKNYKFYESKAFASLG